MDCALELPEIALSSTVLEWEIMHSRAGSTTSPSSRMFDEAPFRQSRAPEDQVFVNVVRFATVNERGLADDETFVITLCVPASIIFQFLAGPVSPLLHGATRRSVIWKAWGQDGTRIIEHRNLPLIVSVREPNYLDLAQCVSGLRFLTLQLAPGESDSHHPSMVRLYDFNQDQVRQVLAQRRELQRLKVKLPDGLKFDVVTEPSELCDSRVFTEPVVTSLPYCWSTASFGVALWSAALGEDAVVTEHRPNPQVRPV